MIITRAEKLNAEEFIKKLKTYQSKAAAKAHSHLAADEEDVIMGVRMGQIFALAKEFIDMPPDEIERLLESPIHEVRVGAVSIMDWQARRKKISDEQRKILFNLYIRRHDRINNWDLVDRSAPYVVGGYLIDKPRRVLYKLARSKNTWERRTAIVSSGYFIRQGEVDDTFKIAEILLDDDHDLIHKATGWMLRAAGDVDREKLIRFLDAHVASMPRTTLRYATEHLEKEQRAQYLKKAK
ncbi:MAG TPA: DNA alkylation repair protein [Anaerolineales bacterium]|nr:DNA alkylation repair protein [Anaerolineales bacterium]